ncbi:MAG: acyl-CoA dehydrogenase family protein [Parachlamydiaceae bacterium]|nr:acyl-CoA dehydrogenase family protein [Parachlamydiaceae bacterium]
MDDEQRKLAEELLFSENRTASFARLIYFGIVDPKTVFPFPNPSFEEKEKVDAFILRVEEYAKNHIDGDKIDREASIPDEVVTGLGQLGVLGMTIPQKYGGLGMSQYAYCRTVEIISRYCGSTALFVNAHQSIGLKALLLFGTEEQKQHWLPPLARGECLAAFSLTEPNAGSDANGIETRAVFDKDKHVWRINGRKQWTTNGAIASVLTVMARTEVQTPEGKEDKITAFLVTPDMPGFQVTASALEKVGMRGSKTANLEFHDLEVPAENVLGPLGGGLKVCLTVLDYGRTTFGAACTGAAKYLYERALQQVINRYQFKRPLGSFGLVKKKIGTMGAVIYAMEAATYLTASLIDSHCGDIMLESAILKVFASDKLWDILYDTMQIYGGRSFFTSEPFERMMRDARLNMIGEGSNEVMRVFIGAVGLRDVGLELKAAGAALKTPFSEFGQLTNFTGKWIQRLSAPTIPVKSETLQSEARQLGKEIRRFGLAVSKLLIAYREGIIERQQHLDRLASCAMAIYTAMAVLSRLDFAIQNSSGASVALETEIFTGKAYCKLASELINNSLEGLNNNDDNEIEKLSDRLTGIRFP